MYVEKRERAKVFSGDERERARVGKSDAIIRVSVTRSLRADTDFTSVEKRGGRKGRGRGRLRALKDS